MSRTPHPVGDARSRTLVGDGWLKEARQNLRAAMRHRSLGDVARAADALLGKSISRAASGGARRHGSGTAPVAPPWLMTMSREGEAITP